MSYILDALRKSESERRQGRIPDLGTTVQMVHKKRTRGLHWSFWVVLALAVNAGVFAYLFWPRPTATVKPAAASAPEQKPAPTQTTQVAPKEPPATSSPVAKTSPVKAQAVATQAGVPTLIVPSSEEQKPASAQVAPQKAQPKRAAAPATPDLSHPDSIPLLVDESPAFQRQVPPLHFSGHIYSSVPSARRVVINDMYLGEGDSLGDLKVERITESGVVFDLHGQLFRVGVVSDWNGPN